MKILTCVVTTAALTGAAFAAGAQLRPGERSLQLTAGSNLDGSGRNLVANYGISYGKRLAAGRSFRIGLSYVDSRLKGPRTISAITTDSLRIRTRTTYLGYLALSGSLERERQLVRNSYVVAGLDGRLGWGGGGTDSSTAYYRGPVTEGTESRSFRSRHDEPLSAAFIELRPYFGVRIYPGKHFYLGADFGPSMAASVQYGPQQSGSQWTMNLFLFTSQLRLGYRF